MKFPHSELRKLAWEAEGREHTPPQSLLAVAEPRAPVPGSLGRFCREAAGRQQCRSSSSPFSAPRQLQLPPLSPQCWHGAGKGQPGGTAAAAKSLLCARISRGSLGATAMRCQLQRALPLQSTVSPHLLALAVSPICSWGMGWQLL